MTINQGLARKVIKLLAIEHALGQHFGSCRCGHVRLIHLADGYGSCTGDKCRCVAFRGINDGRRRDFERFGVALLSRLAEVASTGQVDQALAVARRTMKRHRQVARIAAQRETKKRT